MRANAIPSQLPRISLEEFLSNEIDAHVKHEFHDGLVTMMAGGSAEHALIATRVARELGNLAKATRCEVFNSDMAVWIAASKTHLNPDVSVVCGKWEVHGSKRSQLTNPKLIVEVLSPSTRDYDLSKKFNLYQGLSSFEEYFAFESTKAELHYWSKGPAGKWSRKKFAGPNATVPIRALGKTLALAEIYADT